MTFKRTFDTIILIALLLLTASYSCNAETTIIDMAGREVRIPTKINKVLAVGHCIPIIAAIAPDKLANNYNLSDQSKALLPASITKGKLIPKNRRRYSEDEIKKIAPDIVVMEINPNFPDHSAEFEKKYNAPVIMISQDMHKYQEAFAFLGSILDQKEQAKKLSNFITSYLEPIEKTAQSIPIDKRVSVYYAEGKDGLMSEPQGSNHIQALEYAGGISVAQITKAKRPLQGPPPPKMMEGPGKEKKLRPRPNMVTIEQISKWNPSYILVWSPGAEELTTWNAITTNPQWQTVNAVKEGKMIQVPSIPYSWFDRPPGSNRIIGTIWLAKLFYPDKYDFHLIPIMQEYFKLFYHYQLSTEQAVNLLKIAHPNQQ